MMERFRGDREPADRAGATSATTTTGRTSVHEPVHEPGADDRDRRFAREDTISAGTMAAARRRQREEYGGINWGAAFFGFLAAAGLAAILTGLVSAAGATLALGS